MKCVGIFFNRHNSIQYRFTTSLDTGSMPSLSRTPPFASTTPSERALSGLIVISARDTFNRRNRTNASLSATFPYPLPRATPGRNTQCARHIGVIAH